MTELSFKGKEFVYNHHLSVPIRPLVPHADKGIGEVALDGNLIVHGDNLHALKALLPMYAGKVDCVFIDPPYNTGNEGWAYSDNVNAPMIREWLAANPIGIDDGLRHDKWCAMMWPRLRLLHELLSNKGTIWITLDGNEVHRTKLMLDAIFGEHSHLGTLIWEKSDSPRMDAHTFSSSHDFILSYAKNSEDAIFQKIDNGDSKAPDHYNLTDERGRSFYLKPLRAMGGQGDSREARPNLHYALAAPDGGNVYPKRQDGSDGAWRWSKKKTIDEAARIEWREGRKGWTPYFRIYADTSSGRPPETIWYHHDVGSSRTAKAQIKQLFSEVVFDTPKPVKLIERILEIATETTSTILDSFAGSGTTAHAVLTANARDGGNRRFILCEMEGYADTLTAERVRRVINGYAFEGTEREDLLREKLTWSKLKTAGALVETVAKIEAEHGDRFDRIKQSVKDGTLIVTGERDVETRTEGLGGTFTYCTLGPAIEMDKLLTGVDLPPFAALGAALFHTATNRAFDPKGMDRGRYYLGRADDRHIWLLYKPNLEWLKSTEAALTLAQAERIAAFDRDASHLVFAPARFVSNAMLRERGLKVEFVPLPFALYRFERG